VRDEDRAAGADPEPAPGARRAGGDGARAHARPRRARRTPGRNTDSTAAAVIITTWKTATPTSAYCTSVEAGEPTASARSTATRSASGEMLTVTTTVVTTRASFAGTHHNHRRHAGNRPARSTSSSPVEVDPIAAGRASQTTARSWKA